MCFFFVFFGVDIGVVILPKMKKMVLGRLLFPIGKALFRGVMLVLGRATGKLHQFEAVNGILWLLVGMPGLKGEGKETVEIPRSEAGSTIGPPVLCLGWCFLIVIFDTDFFPKFFFSRNSEQ